ncbi:MAG: malate dehydrogenase [archaeon]|nr:malate dehydrogenase [archaeon]MCP8314497.1 malate dehydrogenase [archaeon]MCP8320046.1 malate dehydrogenase [archaeon]
MLISIVGLGKVGSTIAEHILLKGLDDLTLIDIIEGLPQGNALDLSHMASELNIDVKIKGSNDYKDLEGSDIVIVSAGFPRTPDMSRLDLLQKNKEIIKQISKKILEYAPKSKIITVTNPLDLMTYLTLKTTGFNRNIVFGVGSELDAARLKYYLSSTLKVSNSSISAFVIGEHGDSMVILKSQSKVNGVPIEKILNESQIASIIEKTKKSGADVISLKGATTFGVAASTSSIIESIIKDKKKAHLVSFYLNGEYGFYDVCIGVPVIIGKNGVERVIELELDKDERELFLKSAEVIKKTIPLLMNDA